MTSAGQAASCSTQWYCSARYVARNSEAVGPRCGLWGTYDPDSQNVVCCVWVPFCDARVVAGRQHPCMHVRRS